MYKVLLVDDEPAALDSERRAINRKTDYFEVVGEAYSVDEAIKLYETLQPDVILTDMKMPRRNGIELIEYVTNQENNKTVCIAVSGYSDFDYVHDAFLNGAFDYLLKPVDPKRMEELFFKIQRLLISSREVTANPKLPKKKLSSKELVQEIDAYIRNNLAGDNSILTICRMFMISQPYLSRAFKSNYNCTYNEYLIRLKLEEAKRLLEQKEEYLIGEVAELSGFSDQFYFSKVFKNATGLSPREYRNREL